MIPAGRKYVTPERAAEILGYSLGWFQSQKLWEKLPATVKSFARPGAKRPLRLWDEAQLLAYAAQKQLPFDQQDIPVLPVDPQNPRPQDLQDDDLLDYLEAWESMPEDDRPKLGAWETYVKARSKTGPTADVTINGTRYWKRRTIREWNENRPKGHGAARTGGRVAGSKNTVAIVRPEAVARVRRAAEILEANPGVPALTLAKQLVEEFGVSERTGERLLADAGKGAAQRGAVPELLHKVGDQPLERIVPVVADKLDVPPAVAAFLIEDVQQTAKPRSKK